MNYRWDFNIVWDYRYALAEGLGVSLLVTLLAIVLGTLLALPLALGMVSSNGWIRTIATAIVQLFRSLPLMVSLIFAYYFLPAILGFDISSFATALVVFSLNLGAFAADVLRGGIAAIPNEHLEAGIALGMTRATVARRIVVPETFRRSIAVLAALYVSLFKYSPVVSVISVRDLMGRADLIVAERYKPLEVYLAVAVIYMIVLVPAGLLARWIERHRWFAILPEQHL